MNDDGDFLIRLAELLDQGFSIEVAISYLSITSPKERLRYKQILTSLEQGNTFYTAIKQANFPEFISAPIFYAAEHGYFTKTLHECGTLLKKKSRTRKNT
ncbi:hypothetical protein MFLO_08167 [Listeria floridensis FSL S10-1187]|uniref:Type II secretion system protein GspF domain-containing protein n=1 Tax=Listeria floridensis FSL S10-1187 TaxID=1265817 RepID=A0ABN0REX0_9LIST|nr:type II secretion system F family protein [Listeria floridensis]EUJ31771.1 hypothetical protein MFLO_08167 [Listeria floridensis FSL S10-1187]